MNARTDFSIEAVDHPALRRAALALHATENADRAWLLAQISPKERPALDRMLKDLDTLGLPRDPAMIEELLNRGSASRPAVPNVPAGNDEGLSQLRRCAPADLAALLEHEPAALVAHVVALLPLAIRPGVLERVSAPKRRQVQEALAKNYPEAGFDESVDSAPRLTRALLHALLARLPQPAVPLNLWQRLSGSIAPRGRKALR